MAEHRGRIKVETSPKRVRILLAGEFVADSHQVRLVWEKPYFPTYYVPVDDVRADALMTTDATEHSPSRGDGTLYDVRVGERVAPQAALRYADSPIEELRDLVRFDWDAMDAWYEEDDEVFVHARDPYKRIDVLSSSTHVEVLVDDLVVADSRRALLLFESRLPTRYYLPQTDLRLDLLRPSDYTSRCPYKGTAEYWHLDTGTSVHQNAVWTYRFPTLEVARIAGHAAFFNVRVYLRFDGELQERPRSPFS
jgi:uncharacterized protein (DUF427 family)